MQIKPHKAEIWSLTPSRDSNPRSDQRPVFLKNRSRLRAKLAPTREVGAYAIQCVGANFSVGANFARRRKQFFLNWSLGCQIFLGIIYQNGDIYQIATKYTKWPYNISNGHKIDQMTIKYLHQHLPLQGPPKCIQITIFGLKINHLTTLDLTLKMLQGFRLQQNYLADANVHESTLRPVWPDCAKFRHKWKKTNPK
jgi:hypothetical protein